MSDSVERIFADYDTDNIDIFQAMDRVEAYISKRELELLKDMQQEHETGAFYSKIIEERIEKLNLGDK